MFIEQCQVDFDIQEYKCENCKQEFYCYLRNSTCPHCDHENSEQVMVEGVTINEIIVVDLNRKTMEFAAYSSYIL